MINTYEQTKVAAYILMLQGALDYWNNELLRIESEPVVIKPAPLTTEEISKFKKALDEATPQRKQYPSGGIVCPNPEPSESATSNDGVNWTPTKRGVKAKPVVTHIEEAGPVDPGVLDTITQARSHRQNHYSIDDLWQQYKHTVDILEPVDGGHAIEFARMIRRKTIDEVKSKTTARIVVSEGPFKHAIPQLTEKVDIDFIPKNL